MGAVYPIALAPRCPASEDPGILGFLRLAKTVTGATWAALELQPNGPAPAQNYRLGSGEGKVAAVSLEVESDFDATLQLGGILKLSTELVKLLSESLARVLEHRRMLIQTELLRGAMDTTPNSVLLFDYEGDILFANPPADNLLSQQTEAELFASCRDQGRQPLFTLLSSLVEAITSGDPAASTWKGTLELDKGRVMGCEVIPLPESAVDVPNAVLVLLQPLESDAIARMQAFSSSYGLSPREQEVLGLLGRGLTTGAMAEELGISPHTVRDHLKHLYRKTGTKGRNELLGLISRAS
jgi:DNA-binding CsgD family transcriptional regulator/PAS domain-containing protein